MHSCRSILYFVLSAFVLNLFAFKILFREGFGKWNRKEKKRKEKRKTPAWSRPGRVAAAQQCPPSSPSLSPTGGPERGQPGAPSSLSIWLVPGPCPSLSLNSEARSSACFPVSLAETELVTNTAAANPEVSGFPWQGGKPSPIKLFPQSRSFLLYLGHWVEPQQPSRRSFGSRQAESFPHREPRSPLALDLRKLPRWVRTKLRFVPMPLVCWMVLGNVKTANSGEVFVSPTMAPPRAPLFRQAAGQPSVKMEFRPPDRESTAHKWRYPFAWKFF